MTGEPVYLYGYGNRRHIAYYPGSATALCGGSFDSDARMEAEQRSWYQEKVALRRIEKKRNLPVCSHCQRVQATRERVS